MTREQRDRLAAIRRQINEIDRRTKDLEVEVTLILAQNGIAAKDMGDEVFEFIYNAPHDLQGLLEAVGISAERSAETSPSPLSNSRGGT